MTKRNAMTPSAASRIQSATSKSNGGSTPKGSFATRAQSSLARNTSTGSKK